MKLKKIETKSGIDSYRLTVEGHAETLTCSTGVWRCGKITDGVSFHFGKSGGWVVPLEELREIVRLADEVRRNVPL